MSQTCHEYGCCQTLHTCTPKTVGKLRLKHGCASWYHWQLPVLPQLHHLHDLCHTVQQNLVAAMSSLPEPRAPYLMFPVPQSTQVQLFKLLAKHGLERARAENDAVTFVVGGKVPHSHTETHIWANYHQYSMTC